MIQKLLLGYLALAQAATASAAAGGEGESNPFAGDLGNALWTVIIFVLVLVVLGKFAWGPILQSLQKREAFIRDSLEQARRSREESESRLKEYTDKLTTARAEASAIVEEGRRDAEVLKRQIEETARSESAAMLERARREIAIATETAVKELYSLGAQLSTEVAARVIQKEMDAKQHERIIQDCIEELQQSYTTRRGGVLPAGRN